MKHQINISKELNIPVEKVYDAWLNPSSIKKWMCPGEGVTVPDPKIDAKVGGKFDFTMKVGDKMLPHTGSYLILDRPTKIQFTWISEHTHQHASVVTLEFVSLGKNRTKLNLLHEQLPSEEKAQAHFGGWSRAIKCLDEAFSL